MKIKINYLTGLILQAVVLFSISPVITGQIPAGSNTLSQEAWKQISPFFSPPDSFKEQYGNYRSPLKFYNGQEVRSPGDWKKRRKEILDRWHEMMGPWPPLIKKQKMEILETTREDGYLQHRIRFRWLPDKTTEGYLLIPESKGKKPAVVTVYYEPETAIGKGKSENRDFARQLAKQGFVTLSVGTTETSDARTYSLYYPDINNAQLQPLSALAYAAANCWYLLSEMPGVNPSLIGITGHSYGGKWSMFASCLFEKYACAVWSDPGIVFDETRSSVNYWEPWYLGYYPPPWRKRGMITPDNPSKGLYLKLVADGYDLHELHALMAPRPFLVSGGSEDTPKRWIPLNHTIAVNKLLGYENRVAMTNRPDHSPNEESNAQICAFFRYFLMDSKALSRKK
jgi:hypothetical protein